MARRIDKEKAIKLRQKGMSYSQIKSELGISKSTLSSWLENMPLSEDRIKELRDFNPIRIERCRNTKLKHKQERLDKVFLKASKDIGTLNKRELFLSGLFLYWGEGTKTSNYVTAFTNTDPSMTRFFIKWITVCFGVDKEKLSVRLHLYKDMSVRESTNFWVKNLGIKLSQFKKPYIKESKLSDLTYKTGFGHGTCNIILHNRDIKEYIKESLNYLRNI